MDVHTRHQLEETIVDLTHTKDLYKQRLELANERLATAVADLANANAELANVNTDITLMDTHIQSLNARYLNLPRFKTLFRSYAASLGGLSLLMLYTIFANFSIPTVYYTRRTLCFAFIIPLLNINLNPLYTYTFCQPRIPYTSPAILANFASTCPGYTRLENGTIDPSDYIAYVPHLVRQSLYEIYSTRRFFEQTNPSNGSEVIHALAAAYDAYNTTYTAQTQYVRDLATAVMPFKEVTGAFLAAIQRQQGMISNRTHRRPTSDTCPPSWSTFPPLLSPAKTIFNPSVHPLAPHYISLLYTLHQLPSPPLPPISLPTLHTTLDNVYSTAAAYNFTTLQPLLSGRQSSLTRSLYNLFNPPFDPVTEALLATQAALQRARNVVVLEWDGLLRLRAVLGQKAELITELGAKVEAVLTTGPSLEPPSGWEEGDDGAVREWQDHLHSLILDLFCAIVAIKAPNADWTGVGIAGQKWRVLDVRNLKFMWGKAGADSGISIPITGKKSYPPGTKPYRALYTTKESRYNFLDGVGPK